MKRMKQKGGFLKGSLFAFVGATALMVLCLGMAACSSGNPEVATTTQNNQTQGGISLITENAAKASALKHAEYTEADIVEYTCELEPHEDGGVYLIRFIGGAFVHMYEVDGVTGEVLSAEKSEHPATLPPETFTESVQQPEAQYVEQEVAVVAALRHAQIAREDAEDLAAERRTDGADNDYGAPYYEIVFQANGIRYSYHVHAVTAEVLAHTVREPSGPNDDDPDDVFDEDIPDDEIVDDEIVDEEIDDGPEEDFDDDFLDDEYGDNFDDDFPEDAPFDE